uniref:Ribose-phosphate diphosphokinase n=1 Tax=Heterorhabditis bacteriophora TaxID=37862 RepID=A0A1I7X360_HETBA
MSHSLRHKILCSQSAPVANDRQGIVSDYNADDVTLVVDDIQAKHLYATILLNALAHFTTVCRLK